MRFKMNKMLTAAKGIEVQMKAQLQASNTKLVETLSKELSSIAELTAQI